MNGAAGTVQSHLRTILSVGLHRACKAARPVNGDRFSNGFGQVGAENNHKNRATLPAGSLRGPHLTRRCSRRFGLSRSVQGTARASPPRG